MEHPVYIYIFDASLTGHCAHSLAVQDRGTGRGGKGGKVEGSKVTKQGCLEGQCPAVATSHPLGWRMKQSQGQGVQLSTPMAS